MTQTVENISDKVSDPAFDRKASVKAVFEAAVAVSGADTSYPDKGKVQTARVKKAHLEQLVASWRPAGGDDTKLPGALGAIANTLLGEGSELDFIAVKRAARRVPRVSGQRMEGCLDAALARHLNPGTIFPSCDCLK